MRNGIVFPGGDALIAHGELVATSGFLVYCDGEVMLLGRSEYCSFASCMPIGDSVDCNRDQRRSGSDLLRNDNGAVVSAIVIRSDPRSSGITDGCRLTCSHIDRCVSLCTKNDDILAG